MSDKNICELCEKEVKNLTSSPDGDICDDCLGEDYFTCEDCKGVYNKNDSTYIEDHGYVCESCYDNYSYCEDCEAHYDNSDMISVYKEHSERYVCSDYLRNYTECVDCGQHHYSTYTTNNNSNICRDCYDNEYFTCDDCDEIYHFDYRSEDEDYTTCDDCYEDSSSSIIKRYSYTPTFKYYGKGLYLGLELEIEIDIFQ